jgi:hypothetical protein
LELFALYGIDVPLATKGWFNNKLVRFEVTANGGYSYSSYQNKGRRTSYMGNAAHSKLNELRRAVQAIPIAEKLAQKGLLDATETAEPAKTEVKKGVENKLYERFAALYPQIASGTYEYMKLESPGFEPLSIEFIGDGRVSVMHTYTMNGDLMYDPMMMFDIDRDARTMTAHEFEQSMPPLYQRVTEQNGDGLSVDGNGRGTTVRNLQGKLNEFAGKWFDNLEQQGHMPVRATIAGLDEDARVLFGKDGKAFWIGMGHMGNGVMVWNRLDEKDGDYATIAHIGADRTVKHYEKDLPQAVVDLIDREARTSDMSVSATQDFPVFNTPPEGHAYDLRYYKDNSGEEIRSGTGDHSYYIGRVMPNGGVYIANDSTPESVRAEIEKYAAEHCGARVQPEKPTAPDLSLPDASVTLDDMAAFGYTDTAAMFPLSIERAIELFESGNPVYLLYPDNTESMPWSVDEIKVHDGLCGIEVNDWERIQAAEKPAVTENSRESELLHGDKNLFGVYQIRDDIDEPRDFRFAGMRELEAHGLAVDRANYELVYTGKLPIRDTQTNLHRLFNVFQHDSPECPHDFTSRSMSVSDVIVLQWRGEVSAHFVDSAGFTELPAFTGEERQQPATPDKTVVEQTLYHVDKRSDQAPTVAELENTVKSGGSISLMDLAKATRAEQPRQPAQKAKPDFLAKIAANKQRVAQQQPAQKTIQRGGKDDDRTIHG